MLMEKLRNPLHSVRLLFGPVLLAVAVAVVVSINHQGWKAPVAAFVFTVGILATVYPIARLWYQNFKSRDDEQPYSWTITISIITGLLVVATSPLTNYIVVTMLLIAGAATLVGVLLGFLFGIPRVATRSTLAAAPDSMDDSMSPSLQTNTNLEAISDWLTKIIVGISLVQADEIVAHFDALLTELAGAGFPRPAMGGTILFFVSGGFLSGYLWTRLILTRYFTVSERALRETPESYEGLMNAYLYQPKPQGFRNVIRLFEQYRRRFGEPRHSRLWVYLAAAYGQQYAWMRLVEGKNVDSPDLQPVVDHIVRSIKSAVASDPDSLELLQDLTKEGYDADLLMVSREKAEVHDALQPS